MNIDVLLSLRSDPNRGYAIFTFKVNSEKDLKSNMFFSLVLRDGMLDVFVDFKEKEDHTGNPVYFYVFESIDDIRYFVANCAYSGLQGKMKSCRHEKLETYGWYPEGGNRAFIKKYGFLPKQKDLSEEQVTAKMNRKIEQMNFADDW